MRDALFLTVFLKMLNSNYMNTHAPQLNIITSSRFARAWYDVGNI
jgi:hypothetical protein